MTNLANTLKPNDCDLLEDESRKDKLIIHCGYNGYFTGNNNPSVEYSTDLKCAKRYSFREVEEIYASLETDHPASETTICTVDHAIKINLTTIQ